MAEERIVSRGIGFFPLLGIMFIGLKLTGFIAWSWLWVLAPIWAPFALLALWVVAGALVVAILEWLKR